MRSTPKQEAKRKYPRTPPQHPRTYPQRAVARSINAHPHSHAVEKPFTTIASHTHQALTTIASKASQKTLTSINGQLAVINVHPPREAQKQVHKPKYPHKKQSQNTHV